MLTKVATVEHTITDHSAEDHEVWDILSRRNLDLIQQVPFDPRFMLSIQRLGMVGNGIPSFEKVSRTIFQTTGWKLYHPVAGTTNKDVFALFAQKKFPVLATMRPRSQIDRAEAPDLFHDYWGHLWMFLDPNLATMYEQFGHQSVRVIDAPTNFWLITHLYTNTLEFGLQWARGQVKGFGAALASSSEELSYSLHSPLPRRVRLDPTCESDVLRAMRTRYHFDELQETYFVVTDWQALHALLKSNLTPYYAKIADLPRLKPGEPCESDVLIAL